MCVGLAHAGAHIQYKAVSIQLRIRMGLESHCTSIGACVGESSSYLYWVLGL